MVRFVTFTFSTNLLALQWRIRFPIITIHTFITIDTFRIISTVETNTTATIITVYIDRFAGQIHLFTVGTVFRMSKTVTFVRSIEICKKS